MGTDRRVDHGLAVLPGGREEVPVAVEQGGDQAPYLAVAGEEAAVVHHQMV